MIKLGNEQGWDDQIQTMFARIAKRYDLMNRLMTFGQDQRWRREVIRQARVPANGWLLDLGAGTGELGRQALRAISGCRVIAADFTLEMMRTGKQQPNPADVYWCSANALCLPYPDGTFDAIVSGFLLRNVGDIQQCLAEQYRVLKPGGWLVALDTTRPTAGIFTPLVNFHLHTTIPFLGIWITGDKQAYSYLPASTERFLPAEELASCLLSAGFRQISFQRYMFGTIAIHRGMK